MTDTISDGNDVVTTVADRPGPRILSRPEHSVSRDGISESALKVLYRLHRAGYLAYLVGGGVRDLLLGRRPKDFDVATNARPAEIRRLFRNSRIIGRRFRLVHVLFRGEMVEVSTFRASPEAPEAPEDPDSWEKSEDAAEESVEPTPDSVYGTPDQDALRRDFTVNALFYDISDFSIIDHVGGLEDLQNMVLRTIGEPVERFAEDPVRMLRAHEYSVRLGFMLDDETVQAIKTSHGLIVEAAPARLTYELLETLRSGCSAGIIDAWHRAGLLGEAFSVFTDHHEQRCQLLAEVDTRHQQDARFSDASLLGTLFLPGFLEMFEEVDQLEGRFDRGLLLERLDGMLDEAGRRIHLTKHVVHQMGQALFTLTKMKHAPERGRQVAKLARQEYFPVAWDLLTLATCIGYSSREIALAWRRAVERVRGGENLEQADQSGRPPRRRRRPRRRRQT